MSKIKMDLLDKVENNIAIKISESSILMPRDKERTTGILTYNW